MEATEPDGYPLPELFSAAEWRRLARRLRLSRRQVEIARFICLGLSNPAIARETGLAMPTVGMHVRALLKKLRTESRVGVPVRLILECRASRRPKGDAT